MNLRNIFKKLATASVLGAGVIGVGAYLAMSPRGQAFREGRDEQVAQIPPLLTPQDLMAGYSQSMVANGPAEGRGEYDFRNMVNAGRGRSLEQGNPAQPNIDPALAFQQI